MNFSRYRLMVWVFLSFLSFTSTAQYTMYVTAPKVSGPGQTSSVSVYIPESSSSKLVDFKYGGVKGRVTPATLKHNGVNSTIHTWIKTWDASDSGTKTIEVFIDDVLFSVEKIQMNGGGGLLTATYGHSDWVQTGTGIERVGVGGSPNSGYNLDVYGDARARGNFVTEQLSVKAKYIDNDDIFPATDAAFRSDDWIKINGFIELNPSNTSRGIKINATNNTSFLNITHRSDWSYFAFNQDISSTNFFLRGNGTDVQIANRLQIGTTNIDPTFKLAVNGHIRAKEIKVETGWSDFVFEETYDLPSLEQVEAQIKEKGHLKDIPSAAEVAENGIYLGEMDAKLLQKIEELTLYIIEQNKRLDQLEDKNAALEEVVATIKGN